jgi:hypothetical protein
MVVLFSLSRLLFTEALAAMKEIDSGGNAKESSFLGFVEKVCENSLEGNCGLACVLFLIQAGWTLLNES